MSLGQKIAAQQGVILATAQRRTDAKQRFGR